MIVSTTNRNSAVEILDNHMSIQAAADYSGYNTQYLRRLVSTGIIRGTKIGQIWLIEVSSLDAYVQQAQGATDRRFGPRVYQTFIQTQEH